MAIKSSVSEKYKLENIDFPCLMKHKSLNYIVLFESYARGVVVYSKVGGVILSDCSRFFIEDFENFNGAVLLENK